MPRSLRLRVFAGPNGSGKTTIINAVRKARVNGRGVDFGAYINADDIARSLGTGFDLSIYDVETGPDGFHEFAERSGLLGKDLTLNALSKGMLWTGSTVRARAGLPKDRAAQLLAQYLYDALLTAKKKFSFETVFSHSGKLELMRRAGAMGYKVYLYFISTEDPAINVQRVKEIRVKEGGHDVPKDKIISRYKRTMEHLKDAMGLAYHAYLWDNSKPGMSTLFCEMKRTDGAVTWNIEVEKAPIWFLQHFLIHYPEDAVLYKACYDVIYHQIGLEEP